MPKPLAIPEKESQYLARRGRKSRNGVAFRWKGDEVEHLQKALLALGYSLPNHGADGKFGRETGRAVRKFQSRHQDPLVKLASQALLDDGIVGPHTAVALNGALARDGEWFKKYKHTWLDENGELQTAHFTYSPKIASGVVPKKRKSNPPKVRFRARGDIIEQMEELIYKETKKKVRYESVKDTYKKYLQAKRGSQIRSVVKDEFENLPFAGTRSVAKGMKSFTPWVPLEMPSVLQIAETSYHPKGFVAIKKGLFDVLVGLDTIGESFKDGERWRYLRDEVKSPRGIPWKIKDDKGNLARSHRGLLTDKLKRIDKCKLALEKAVKGGNKQHIAKAERTLYKEINSLIDVKKFQDDVDDFWRSVQPDIKKGKADIAIVNFKGTDEFEVSFKKNKIRWTIKAEVLKSGDSIKLGKALNIMAVADPDALADAQRKLRDMNIKSFRYAQMSKSGMKERVKALIFDTKARAKTRGTPKGFFMPSSPSYARLFLGGLGFSAWDGFLDGLLALSKGEDVPEALKTAGESFLKSVAVGFLITATIKTIGRLGTKGALALAARSVMVREFGKKAAESMLVRGAGRLATKAIPFVGWGLMAFEGGYKMGRAINNFLMKDYRKYHEEVKGEFEAVRKPYDNTAYLAEYFKIDEFEIRAPRWRFTGLPVAMEKPYKYDLVPRSIKIKTKDKTVIEYGDELLLPTKKEKVLKVLPFCQYLPRITSKDESGKLYKKILDSLATIHLELDELENSTEWLYDGVTGWNNVRINAIESSKQWIGVWEQYLNTKWAHYVTPDGSEMYLWSDRTGRSYCWAGAKGEFESDPKKALEAKDMIEQIRKNLGIQ